MESTNNSIVADMNLAAEGRLKIDWAKDHMPVMNRLREKFIAEKPLLGTKVVISLHLESKTACLAELLYDAGAEVVITGSNPLSTQDDVCAGLAASGVTVFAKYNPPAEEYKSFLIQALETRPDYIIDDGGDLITILHSERPELSTQIRGGCEETTTGILRLKSLEKSGELRFPMVAVNDASSKYLFDNRYGTGQSVWDGINRTTNLVVAGKTVVVVGYGWCGRGVAMRAKGLGAKVIITEVDAIKATEAYMDGFTVLSMQEAASQGDFFVTVTGNHSVIGEDHYALMKNGAILSNAGHFDVEIDVLALKRQAVKEQVVRKDITEYTMEDGKKIYLLAEGRLVNLAAGDGHPTEIMDMTFSLQALCLLHIHQNYQQLENAVLDVPYELDEKVSRHFLESIGIQIDRLSSKQEEYLSSWK